MLFMEAPLIAFTYIVYIVQKTIKSVATLNIIIYLYYQIWLSYTQSMKIVISGLEENRIDGMMHRWLIVDITHTANDIYKRQEVSTTCSTHKSYVFWRLIVHITHRINHCYGRRVNIPTSTINHLCIIPSIRFSSSPLITIFIGDLRYKLYPCTNNYCYICTLCLSLKKNWVIIENNTVQTLMWEEICC
jgi:hypothetical protein